MNTVLRSFMLCLALVALSGAHAPVGAQEPQALGTQRDWSAFAYSEGGGRVCFVASQPKEAKGDYTQRGDIWTLVTHRSPGGERDVVQIVTGYNYEKDSTVTATIGDRTFELYTSSDTAWAYTPDDDRALIAAMKAGVDMVIRGRSWRGTQTTDRYSLLGFTAAHEIISQACPRLRARRRRPARRSRPQPRPPTGAPA